jgi:hypothetical protein
MENTTIPIHLLIATLFSLGVLWYILANRRKLFIGTYQRWFWISAIVLFSIYGLIVGLAMFQDIYLHWNLNKYDLNNDGMFTGEEISDGQKIAMDRVIRDTGRNLAVITGFIFSAIISFPVFLIGIGIQRLKKR